MHVTSDVLVNHIIHISAFLIELTFLNPNLVLTNYKACFTKSNEAHAVVDSIKTILIYNITLNLGSQNIFL